MTLRRSGPLRRGRALTRAGRLSRTRPIRSVSRKELSRRADLTRFRRDVRVFAGGLCEARISPVCAGNGSQAHHRLPRGQGGPDLASNGLWVCASCHAFIHAHPAISYERGWLLRRPGSS
jgi:hypothetical protein